MVSFLETDNLGNSSAFYFRYSLQILLLILSAIIFALFGEYVHLPLPWLLLPMLVGVFWILIKGNEQSLPKGFTIAGQSIVAVFTGCTFSIDVFTHIENYFLPLLMCIVVTGIFSVLNSYLIHKWADIDLKSSFLGCVPGASASIVAMSDEIGADAIVVAVLQCLRIVMVSIIIPLLLSFYLPDNHNLTAMDMIKQPDLTNTFPLGITLILLSLVAFLGIKLGEKIKLPSNLFLAPFLSSLIFVSLFPYNIIIPHSLFCLGLLLLGLSIGVKFEVKAIHKLAKALILEVALLLLLIIVCLIAGYEFHQLTHIDTLTALLGSTPGALNAMMATAIELGADSTIVLMMQLSRMFLILAFIPLLGNFLPHNQN
jgi:uncharacterized protein